MAAPAVQWARRPEDVPPEVIAEHQRLLSRQKQEDAEFQRRIEVAKDNLFQRHVDEQQHFWNRRPRSSQGRSRNGSAVDPSSNLLTNVPLPDPGNIAGVATAATPRAGSNIPQHVFGKEDAKRSPKSEQSCVQNVPRRGSNIASIPLQTRQSTVHRTGVQEAVENHVDSFSQPTTPKAGIFSSFLSTPTAPKVKSRFTQRNSEVIDLTFDDETTRGSKVATSTKAPLTPTVSASSTKPSLTTMVPNASLSLFGSSTKFGLARQSSRVKEKNKAGDLECSVEYDPSRTRRELPSQLRASLTGLAINSSGYHQSIDKTLELQSGGSKHDSPLSTRTEAATLRTPERRKRRIPLDPVPEISSEALRKQQKYRSSILKNPEKLPRDPSLFSLQEQKKARVFVGEILHNGRSRGWSQGLGKLFDRPEGDIASQDALAAESKQDFPARVTSSASEAPDRTTLEPFSYSSFQSTSPFVHTNSPPGIGRVARGNSVAGTQPPTTPSLKPAPQKTTRYEINSAKFKVPSLPSRATNVAEWNETDSNPFERTAEPISTSLAGSSMPALSEGGHVCEPSVTTQSSTKISLSVSSPTARKRKKQVSVSDEEESEFEPSSPDVGESRTAGVYRSNPPAKRAKPLRRSDSAKKRTTISGFNPPKTARPMTPTSSVRSRATPLTPGAPQGKSRTRRLRSASPESPTPAPTRWEQRKPTPSISSATSSPSPLSARGQRRAKLKAQSRIDQLLQGNAEFYTEEGIRIANEMDDKMNSTCTAPNASMPEQLQGRMDRMSLTPAPEAAKDEAQSRERSGSVYTNDMWIRDRMTGDRHVAKSAQRERSSDTELDPDLWQVVGERICPKNMEIMDSPLDGEMAHA